MTSLAHMFLDTVTRYPERIAIHHLGRDRTYEELACRAWSLAGELRERGVSAGDRVAVLLPNSAEYVAAYFGILLAGGIVVGLNPESSADDLANTVGHCDASAVIVDDRTELSLHEAAPRLPSLRTVIRAGTPDELWQPRDEPQQTPHGAPEDVAQIIYTSGTTARPKGVTLTHRNLDANCRSILDYLELTRDDSMLALLPFFYSYGNSVLLTHVAVGGRLVIATDFVYWNRVLDLMEDQRVTGFSGVPSSYAMLFHRSGFEKRELPDVRYFTCAGGALPRDTAGRLRSAFPHARLFLMYGQTEASARLSTLMPEDLDLKPGSVGRGIPGVSLAVLDGASRPVNPGATGEIVANGDNIMIGYWNDVDATARVLRPEGLRTGDLATVDEDGYIYIVGRDNDMIKSGAYRINPQEIEEVLLELDGVIEVAVTGIPDEILTEIPAAFIVRSAEEPQPSQRDVIRHCQSKMPRYKCVRNVEFVDQLPKTASGKIRRAALRDQFVTHAACANNAETEIY